MGYVSPRGDEITIVIEKLSAAASSCERGELDEKRWVTGPGRATFKLQGSFRSLKTLALWASDFSVRTAGQMPPDGGLFRKLPEVEVVDGAVTLDIEEDHVYTLSTIRTAAKGTAPPSPPREAFPAVYQDDFEACQLSSIPKLLAPMAGAFECVEPSTPSARAGTRVVIQRVPAKAMCTRGDVMPYAILGDAFRTDYNVSVDILLEGPAGGGAFVGARVKGPVAGGTAMDGVLVAVNDSHWRVSVSNVAGLSSNVSAFGPLPPAVRGRPGSWRRLALSVSGTQASAALDDHALFAGMTIPPPRAHASGQVMGTAIPLGQGGYVRHTFHLSVIIFLLGSALRRLRSALSGRRRRDRRGKSSLCSGPATPSPASTTCESRADDVCHNMADVASFGVHRLMSQAWSPSACRGLAAA